MRLRRCIDGWRAAPVGALVTVMLMVACVGAAGAAPPPVTTVDLGGFGGSDVFIKGLSETGQVVGNHDDARGEVFGFVGTADGGLVTAASVTGIDPDARETLVTGISGSGQIIGTALAFAARAFSWTPAGGLVEIPTLAGRYSIPAAVNDDGVVVGKSEVANSVFHPFVWVEGSPVVDLGVEGEAVAVNDNGQVVGNMKVAGGYTHAFSWTQAGGLVDLGTLGGLTSSAIAVNESGQVTGSSLTSGSVERAFIWSAGGGMVNLGTIGGAVGASRGLAINDDGMVVGDSSAPGGGPPRPFAWTSSGGMLALGDLGGNGSGSASDMNNDGLVVGRSEAPDHAFHAFAWTAADGMVDLGASMPGTETYANIVNDAGLIAGSVYISGGPQSSCGPEDCQHLVLWEQEGSDSEAPVIEITMPADAQQIALGAPVLADYSCIEEAGGSGLASCEGAVDGHPVADGAPLPTGTPGTFQLAVAAEDVAGNQSSLTHSYTVVDPDLDDDGVSDTIGSGGGAFAVGGTSGQVLSLGGLDVLVDAAVPGPGVRISVGSGSGAATFSVCGIPVLSVFAGSSLTVSCGSVIVRAVTGNGAQYTLDGRTTVEIGSGDEVEITDLGNGLYSVENLGSQTVDVTVSGVPLTIAGGASLNVSTWSFVGFSSPVDNLSVVNVAKAGQGIPLKWRLVDAAGQPVTSLESAKVTVTSRSCALGNTDDLIEETATGISGLQDKGDGYYQLDWKSPKSYAKSCKTVHLDLGEGITHDAYFDFKK
jgi:probable HAF family extracellular repeat protein